MSAQFISVPSTTPVAPALTLPQIHETKCVYNTASDFEPSHLWSLPEEVQLKILKEVEQNLIRMYFPGWMQGCRLCYGCKMSSNIHLHRDKTVRAGGGFTYRKSDWNAITRASFLTRPRQIIQNNTKNRETVEHLPANIEEEIKRWTMGLLNRFNSNKKEKKEKSGRKHKQIGNNKRRIMQRQKSARIHKVMFGSEFNFPEMELLDTAIISSNQKESFMGTRKQTNGKLGKIVLAGGEIKNKFSVVDYAKTSTKPDNTNLPIEIIDTKDAEQNTDIPYNPMDPQDNLRLYKLGNDFEVEQDDFTTDYDQEKDHTTIQIAAHQDNNEMTSETNREIDIEDKKWLEDNFGISNKDFGIGTKHILNYRQVFHKRVPSFIRLSQLDIYQEERIKDDHIDLLQNSRRILSKSSSDSKLKDFRQKTTIDRSKTFMNLWKTSEYDEEEIDNSERESHKDEHEEILWNEKSSSSINTLAQFSHDPHQLEKQLYSRESTSVPNLTSSFSRQNMLLDNNRSLKKSVSFHTNLCDSRSTNQWFQDHSDNDDDEEDKSSTSIKHEDDDSILISYDDEYSNQSDGGNTFSNQLDSRNGSVNPEKLKKALKDTKRKAQVKRVITQNKKQHPLTNQDLTDLSHPLDFLTKYCIIKENRLPAYDLAFQSILEARKLVENKDATTEPIILQSKKKKKGKRNKQRKEVEQLTQREQSTLNKKVLYNHVNYEPAPGERLVDMEIRRTNFELDSLIKQRTLLQIEYEKIQEELEDKMVTKIKMKYPEIINRIQRSEAPNLNKEIMRRIDNSTRRKITNHSEFQDYWQEINRKRRKLNQLTMRILDVRESRKKLEILRRVQREKAEQQSRRIEAIKREQSVIYQTVHPDLDKEVGIEELEAGLQIVNKQLLSEGEFKYIYHILKLPQHPRLNMQAFSCIAALSEKVTQLEPFTKKLINKFNFDALDSKMIKAKKLFSLMSSDGSGSIPGGTVSIDRLGIELLAGGIPDETVSKIVNKFDREHKGYVDFLDYLTYLPLFVEIHEKIVDNPFDIKKEWPDF